MGRENSGQEGVGRWGPTTLPGRPKVAGPFPSMRSVAWVALIAPARGRTSKEIANIMHTDPARFLWKPKWPWVKTKPPKPAKPPQPSTTVRAGCNARFLLREVHDSGALTGACTGKGPRWQTHAQRRNRTHVNCNFAAGRSHARSRNGFRDRSRPREQRAKLTAEAWDHLLARQLVVLMQPAHRAVAAVNRRRAGLGMDHPDQAHPREFRGHHGSSGDTIPNCLSEFREIRESKERTRGRKGPTTLSLCQKVGGPWYVVSLREFLLLSAPSGLLCGNWGFPSPFPRRCSHGYQVQVKNSSIASLSHHRQAFRIAPPAGSEGRPRALRHRGRGLCQGFRSAPSAPASLAARNIAFRSMLSPAEWGVL